ncbi:hypothetical protein FOG48_03828 [Hanseniaspora uvarum]|nr:hypothetical protein FOG48_03828 [Hanseniaspora uvarum]
MSTNPSSTPEEKRPGIQRLDTEVEYVTQELHNVIQQAHHIIHEDDDEDDDNSFLGSSKSNSNQDPKLTPFQSNGKDYFSFTKNTNNHDAKVKSPLSTNNVSSGPARPHQQRFNNAGSEIFKIIDRLDSNSSSINEEPSSNSNSSSTINNIKNVSFNSSRAIHEDDISANTLDQEYANSKGTSSSDVNNLNKKLEKTNLYNKTKSHNQLNETAHGVRMLNKDLFNTKFRLQIQNILIVTKHYDDKKNNNLIDLVITLGGDGTVLYVSNIFQENVPPVMSFSLGSLGFLTNFEFENYDKSLEKLFTKKITTKLRMRLSCIVFREETGEITERQVLNELVIDRGPSPFISNLEVYGNGSLLTVAQADGLIIATPTGSTAYSLSAGGSLVYPEVNALCITPICPHTLSFRPIILPDSMILTIKVPKDSRSTAWCSFDGKNRLELFKGDKVYIRASEYSFPTVEAKKTEFIDSIRRSLNWNQREPQKSLGHLLSGKNKSKYEKEIETKTQMKNRSYSGVGKTGLLNELRDIGQIQSLHHESMLVDDEDDDDEEDSSTHIISKSLNVSLADVNESSQTNVLNQALKKIEEEESKSSK